MKANKRQLLEQAGFRVTDVQEFMGLNDAEMAFIEIRLSLSNLLRDLRQRKGLTQVQLAKVLGSSQSRVAKMEAAEGTVSVDLLVRSVLALGASNRDIGRVLAKGKQAAAAAA